MQGAWLGLSTGTRDAGNLRAHGCEIGAYGWSLVWPDGPAESIKPIERSNDPLLRGKSSLV